MKRHLIITVLILLTNLCLAQDSQNIKLIGQLKGGIFEDIVVNGIFAYVAVGKSLTILDISNPLKPNEICCYETPASIKKIYLKNSYVYIADGVAGLRIINVLNPNTPYEVSYCPSNANGIYVSEKYAYVIDISSIVRIIDISDISSPTEVGQYSIPARRNYDWAEISVSGKYAYVVMESSGLIITDISNPQIPNTVSFYSPYWPPHKITISGKYAYIVGGGPMVGDGSGLMILDISNPTNPQEIGRSNYIYSGDFYSPTDFFILGNYVYIADAWSGGLVIIDISNPFSPKEVSRCKTRSEAYGVFVSNNYAYVTEGYRGLRIIDISSSSAPVEASFFNKPLYTRKLCIADKYTYLATDTYLSVIDITNPSNPIQVGSCETPINTCGIDKLGDNVYTVSNYYGLKIINVSKPTEPKIIGTCDNSSSTYNWMANDILCVSSNCAYIADYFKGGLAIIDISTPTAPTQIGYFKAPGNLIGAVNTVTFLGKYAYIASTSLLILDISTPTAPVQVGNYDLPSQDICVSGNYAYVANGRYLRILDVSNPINPIEVGSYDISSRINEIYISGNYAYVANDSGLRIINISNSTAPKETGYYTTQDNIFGVRVLGKYAYVAALDSLLEKSDGFLIFEVPPFYIRGSVKDNAENNKDSISINLTGDTTKVTTTNSSGYYEFTDLEPGNYTIIPNRTDWNFYPSEIKFNLDTNYENLNFIGPIAQLKNKQELKIQGGEKGYINPAKNEQAMIILQSPFSGNVSVKIYNVCGELVWETNQNTISGTQSIVPWNCKNGNQDIVASGIYLCCVKGAGMNVIGKFAIVK